jgi:hypothetical protein
MELELKHKIIFDDRNLFDEAKMNNLGYHYESIERKHLQFYSQKQDNNLKKYKIA